jgi:hypothetical protein
VKQPSKRAEIFSRADPDARMFTITGPAPPREVPLPERLAWFKAMKQKIRELCQR